MANLGQTRLWRRKIDRGIGQPEEMALHINARFRVIAPQLPIYQSAGVSSAKETREVHASADKWLNVAIPWGR